MTSRTNGSDIPSDEEDLVHAIHTDDIGDAQEEAEFSAFEQKMKTLFWRVRQMGHAEPPSAAAATDQTQDAHLNLSA